MCEYKLKSEKIAFLSCLTVRDWYLHRMSLFRLIVMLYWWLRIYSFNKDLFLFVISFKQTPSTLMDDPDGLNLTTTAVHVNEWILDEWILDEWILDQRTHLVLKVLSLLPCPPCPAPFNTSRLSIFASAFLRPWVATWLSRLPHLNEQWWHVTPQGIWKCAKLAFCMVVMSRKLMALCKKGTNDPWRSKLR